MLQIFFDLGLSYVIVQFISHEFVKVKWLPCGTLDGEAVSKDRILHIIKVSMKWYSIAATLLICFLLPVGFLFFQSKVTADIYFQWRLPWTLLVITNALNLLLVPIFSLIEGGGLITSIYTIRFIQGVGGTLTGWGTLIVGGGLFTGAANCLVCFIIGSGWLLIKKRELLIQIFTKIKSDFNSKTTRTFSWWNELWPMQWRIAISWLSGFFIFHIFNPVVFYFSGPVAAGKMGMTLTVTNALGSIILSWLTVNVPKFGNFVSSRDWISLDRLFFKVFRQSTFLAVIGALIGVCLIWILQNNFRIGERFLPTWEASLLFGSTIINHIISCFAIYLRAHKKDPFVWLSVIGAIMVSLSTLILGKYLSTKGVVIGCFLINLLYGLPTAFWLWYKLRKKWHYDENLICA